MELKPWAYVDLRWVVLAALAPLIGAGAFAASANAQGAVRYDETYFSEEYIERYDTPGEVARAMEQALKNDDRALLAELQGLRRAADFETDPSMIFVMLWDRGDRYFTYMYFNMDTMERHPHYIEQRKGRWVVAPTDAYYYFHSGDWLRVWAPLAVVWWLVESVAVLGVWVYRMSAHVRSEMYGEGT